MAGLNPSGRWGGSVLVNNGTAYFSAGRHSEADGGIYIYAVDIPTGKIKWVKHPEKLIRNDIIVESKNGNLALSRWLFDLEKVKTLREKDPFLYAPEGFQSTVTLEERTPRIYENIHAEHMVFRGDMGYGTSSLVDVHRRKKNNPGGGEYRLFSKVPSEKGKPRWTTTGLPMRVNAMLLAGDTIFVAGPPDVADPEDPWSVIGGKKGGLLGAYTAEDGKSLGEIKLAAPPIFEGLTAAHEKLFISMQNGKVVCLGGK